MVTTKEHKSEINEKNKTENIWKQPALYLAFASGAGICLLGLGIYYLVKNKKDSKQV